MQSITARSSVTIISKDVVYYPRDQNVESWDYSQEWPKVSDHREVEHPNGHDVLVAPIIDGVAYEIYYVTVIVGGVDDPFVEGTKRVSVHLYQHRRERGSRL